MRIAQLKNISLGSLEMLWDFLLFYKTVLFTPSFALEVLGIALVSPDGQDLKIETYKMTLQVK